MSATISATYLLAWSTLGRKPHALSWSVAFLAAFFQWAFNLNPQWFPSSEFLWLVTSALSLAVVTLMLRGHCQRTECKIMPQNLWPWAAAIYVLIVWSTVAQPHVGVSNAVVPVMTALVLFYSSLLVLKHREVSRPAEVATAVTMIIFGVTQLLAGIFAFMQGPVSDDFYRTLYLNISFMSLPAGYAGVAILTLFMIASDLSAEMKELAISDQLTGTLNRRGFGEQAAAAYATARRTGRPVSVVMTDIDRFKQINDEFGHAAGDVALSCFAGILKANRRDEDICARVGGEEFALVLPGAGLKEAADIASELRTQVESGPIDLNGKEVTMTASFGVAALADGDTCLSDAVSRADTALYRSKREGRNRIDLESSQMILALDGSVEPIST